MSEVEGQVTEQGESQANEVDVKALISEKEALQASKERILAESKDYKAKYQELSQKLEAQEKKKLEENGELEKLLQVERESRMSVVKELEDMKVKTFKSNTKSMLSSVAKDALDVEDLLKCGNVELMNMDEEALSPTKESVEDFVNDLRKRKPFLFDQKLPKVADTHPRGEVPKTEKTAEDVFSSFLKAVNN